MDSGLWCDVKIYPVAVLIQFPAKEHPKEAASLARNKASPPDLGRRIAGNRATHSEGATARDTILQSLGNASTDSCVSFVFGLILFSSVSFRGREKSYVIACYTLNIQGPYFPLESETRAQEE